MAQFAFENVTFHYPGCDTPALDTVSFEIEAGSYVTLCGKSGCGKTTLLRHLKSVLAPHGKRTGQVLFEGVPLEQVSQRDQSAKIGYVMQNPDAQVVTDKVWHELAFGLESLGCDQRTMRLRVAEMASYFGIQGWFHKDVKELSGGQKQLLNLASIMAMQPSVLVLDEPTSQLDPIAAADFLNTVRKINLELGTTIILSEHRLEETFSAADRVLVMKQGRILADGEPHEVGQRLIVANDEMAAALPAPMRIFYGVNSGAKSAQVEARDCPLTVREGRTWLTRNFSDIPADARAMPDAQAYEETDDNIVLSFKDVWFRYDRELPDVLRGTSFDVHKGELFALVGGNGTGKSTSLKCACGINKPYRGTIRIKGKKIKEWKGNDLFKGCIAMLPQDPQNLFVKKTVRADLQEMLTDKKLSAEEAQQKVLEVARTCDIERLLDSHPYDLSGGEQQRAALAKVLLCEPEILLLDEPTKGIDGFFKRELAGVLARLREQGKTIVMVSHDIEFCAHYATSVSMFFDGGIVTTNTPRRFFAQNSFYTTSANRMSRHMFQNAIIDEDVIALCKNA